MQKEYTEQLLDLTDNQYYSEEYPSVQLQYSVLDLDYYGPQLRRTHTHSQAILWVTILHPQDQKMFSAGTHVEEESMHFCMDIDSSEKRPTQQKVERQGKGDKISNNVFEI